MALALEACAGGDPAAAWGMEGSGVVPIPHSDSSQVKLRQPTRNQTAQAASLAEAQRAPRRRGFVWALVGALVPLIAIGVVVATRKPPAPVVVVAPPNPIVEAKPVEPPKPEPPKPVLPTTYQISVRSEPSGAEVFQGPERIGATPLTHDFARSSSEIELVVKKKGYKDQKLRFAPDRNHDFVLPLLSARSSRPAVTARPQPVTARPEPKVEPKPEPKAQDAKPAGKLRDLKDPFAN